MADPLRTAEAVTKFLRSKGTSIDDIVKVSNQLLDDELSIYLPNKVIFVFELLVDRFNDSKNEKFRTNISLWQLFNKTWHLLDNDPRARSRAFQSFKFTEAIAGSFDGFNDGNREEFTRIITQSINQVRLSTSVLSTQDLALKTLSQCLHNISKLASDRSSYVSDICSFFKASLPDEKCTIKFVTAFVSTALPAVLHILSIGISDAKPLVSLMNKTVLSQDALSQLKQNTEVLLKQGADASSMAQYYRLVVDTLSKNDIVMLEDIYAKITEKFPEAAEQQLEYLSKTKRTLSPSFIEMVYQIEFSKPKQNWTIIHSLLELDIEVGVSHGEQIMKGLESQKSAMYVSIGKEIVDAHVRARDLNAFFTTWASLLQQEDSIWANQDFIDVVSKCVVTMSGSQLTSLIDVVNDFESGAKYVVLGTIVQGLFSVKDTNIRTAARVLLSPTFNQQDDETDKTWNLRFQLLCLFEDIVTAEQTEALVSQKVRSSCLHQFYTMFRLREIHEFDITNLASKFVKFLKKSQNATEVIETLFQRWFVLINRIFSSSQIDTIVSYLLGNEKLSSSLICNTLLFEQTNIIESIITTISNSITESNSISELSANVLKTIPIECYPRRVKAPLLDKLVAQLTANETSTNLIFTLITHVLQTPTFKSKIESDIKTLQRIVDIEPHTTIFKTVWKHHIANLKETEHQIFVRDSITHIRRAFDENDDVVTSAFHMANTILNETAPAEADLTAELQETLFSACTNILAEYKSECGEGLDDVTWVLKALYKLDIDTEKLEELKCGLETLGFRIEKSGNVDALSAHFSLYSRVCESSCPMMKFIEELYMVLRERGCAAWDLAEGLGNAIDRLDNSTFEACSRTMRDHLGGPHSDKFVIEIMHMYLRKLRSNKAYGNRFIVAALSTVLMRFSTLEVDSLLLSVQTFRNLIVEKSACFSQYSVELLLTLLTRCADHLRTHSPDSSVELFTSVCQCMSNIVLYNRYRLSNRHHVVLAVFTSLMKALAKRQESGLLQSSSVATEAYQRLIMNLCEPPQSTKEKDGDNLNSSSTQIKKLLRKHLYVLLLTYIQLSLQFGFEPEVRELLLPSVFSIFDVLSQKELVLVSTSLDNSGRVYYRTVYDEYKKVGKWKTD